MRADARARLIGRAGASLVCRSGGNGQIVAWLVSCTMALAGGCAGTAAQRQKLNSPSAFERAEAVVALQSKDDLQSVQKFVDLLDDPDQGVRMMAIVALQRMCGTDFGYHYYDSEAERAPAVERWREALRRGELHIRSGVETDPPGDAAAGRSGDNPHPASASAGEAKPADAAATASARAGSGGEDRAVRGAPAIAATLRPGAAGTDGAARGNGGGSPP